MRRVMLNKFANRKNFRKFSRLTHKKNIYLNHPRGGIRL